MMNSIAGFQRTAGTLKRTPPLVTTAYETNPSRAQKEQYEHEKVISCVEIVTRISYLGNACLINKQFFTR